MDQCIVTTGQHPRLMPSYRAYFLSVHILGVLSKCHLVRRVKVVLQLQIGRALFVLFTELLKGGKLYYAHGAVDMRCSE
jgi:hypothetical protein